ncbi:MAG: ParB/RepB/Spo0J family partition protein [Methyloglobulus sp.]|nr:ParB/RepB/Spo0J family partition protein [Methyloglobulus sp.]
MNKNKNFFAELKQNIEEEKKNQRVGDADNTTIKQNKFEQGLNLTKEIMSGSKVKTPRLLVEPSQCKIWDRHNRDYASLNEIRCKDLIDQFKVTGKQEFPGIVRLIEGGGDVKYEIICGARRFWTCQYLGWKYFVEIRDISDEEAFRLSDLENRAREDISDYERALDYKKALGHYYQNQVQMANRLEVTTSWLSRYLDIADLPEEIVKAYRDITDIKVIHARKLKPYLISTIANKPTRESVINRAIELKGKDLDGSRVIAELLSAVRIKTKANKANNQHTSKNGLVNIQIQKRKDKKIEILIDKKGKGSKQDAIELIDCLLNDYF